MELQIEDIFCIPKAYKYSDLEGVISAERESPDKKSYEVEKAKEKKREEIREMVLTKKKRTGRAEEKVEEFIEALYRDEMELET